MYPSKWVPYFEKHVPLGLMLLDVDKSRHAEKNKHVCSRIASQDVKLMGFVRIT